MVEIIMATFLMSLIILFVFEIYPTSLLGLHRAQEKTVADNLASQVMETVRAFPFSQVPAPGATLIPDETANGLKGFIAGQTRLDGTDYQCQVIGVNVPGNLPPPPSATDPTPGLILKKISVVVQWSAKVANGRGVDTRYERDLMIVNVNR